MRDDGVGVAEYYKGEGVLLYSYHREGDATCYTYYDADGSVTETEMVFQTAVGTVSVYADANGKETRGSLRRSMKDGYSQARLFCEDMAQWEAWANAVWQSNDYQADGFSFERSYRKEGKDVKETYEKGVLTKTAFTYFDDAGRQIKETYAADGTLTEKTENGIRVFPAA